MPDTRTDWQPISSAPEGVAVLTAIDGGGTQERNVQKLVRDGRRWYKEFEHYSKLYEQEQRKSEQLVAEVTRLTEECERLTKTNCQYQNLWNHISELLDDKTFANRLDVLQSVRDALSGEVDIEDEVEKQLLELLAETKAQAATIERLRAALGPFEIQVPDTKFNEVHQVTCGGWHLRAVCDALRKEQA